jgi:protein-S-isoprenylcysteine O-methyltransferase Ste14
MANLFAQIALTLLLIAVAIFIFRYVEHDYRTHGRLSLRSTLLEFLVFGLHCGVSILYPDSSLAHIETSNPLFVVAIIFLVGGLLLILFAMSWLGWKETIGKEPTVLQQAGVYSYSRNP